MAKMKLDPAIGCVRGRVGNYFFRKKRGRMFLSARPDFDPRDPSPAQSAVQERFRLAAEYASEVLQDPGRKAEYERLAKERDEPVQSILMGDFLSPPEVTDLDLTRFKGKVGDVISVRARDDLEVVSVAVKITDPSGAILEQGLAVKLQGVWSYTTTTALPQVQLVTIEATASIAPATPASPPRRIRKPMRNAPTRRRRQSAGGFTFESSVSAVAHR